MRVIISNMSTNRNYGKVVVHLPASFSEKSRSSNTLFCSSVPTNGRMYVSL